MKDILCEIVSPIAQIIIASVAIGNPIVTNFCKRREEKRIAYNLLHGLYICLNQLVINPEKEEVYKSAVKYWIINTNELSKVLDKNTYKKINSILGFDSIRYHEGKTIISTFEEKLESFVVVENKKVKELLSDAIILLEKIYKLKRM